MGFRRGATSHLPLRSQIPCAIEAQGILRWRKQQASNGHKSIQKYISKKIQKQIDLLSVSVDT